MARAQPYVPDLIDDDALTTYVDGSMYGSPRRGGIGIRFVWVNDAGDEETHDESLPSTTGATNNQMELEAPSQALTIAESGRTPFSLSQFKKIVIRTDSMYVYENVNNAIYVWPTTGWTGAGGAAILNVGDWQRLVSMIRRFDRVHRLRVHFEWIPGKKGRHAVAVDKLAKASSNSVSFGRARPAAVRRKLTAAKVEPGIVKVSGQMLTIRIIEAQYLKERRPISRYRYEILTQGPYEGAVDWAESALPLRPAHRYVVRMNADQANPQIAELLAEVDEDLSLYADALRSLGRPATAVEVTERIGGSKGAGPPSALVKARLDKLVRAGAATCARGSTAGRPFVYKAVDPPPPEQAGTVDSQD